MPKRKTEPPPQPKRGRPPGSKSIETTPYTARVYASLTPEQKQELEVRALKRRHAEGLSGRWGVSDLLRELVEAYLSKPLKPAK